MSEPATTPMDDRLARLDRIAKELAGLGPDTQARIIAAATVFLDLRREVLWQLGELEVA